jgi:hypothetical protein
MQKSPYSQADGSSVSQFYYENPPIHNCFRFRDNLFQSKSAGSWRRCVITYKIVLMDVGYRLIYKL